MKRYVFGMLILVSLIVALPPATAWFSYTHTWICNQAGLSDFDCNQADNQFYQSQHPELSNSNHFCINNTDDCSARTLADKWFTTNANVSLHLWADSLSPVHWKKFDNVDCHDVFEDCVESNLRLGNTQWKCEFACVVPATGEKVINTADYNYMLDVVKYVREQYDREKWKQRIIRYGAFALMVLGILLGIKYARKSSVKLHKFPDRHRKH